MKATKKKGEPSKLRRMLLAPVAILRAAPWTRQMFVIVLVGILVVAGSLGLWGKVRSHVQSQSEYMAPLSALEITPPPPWIKADIRAEVIRDAGLPQKLSILDTTLTERLAHAFTLHPWIARVDGVRTSYPAKIEMKLTYRKPVAMVAVYGGLLPIDAEGVLLPTEDFTPEAAKNYPRVTGVTSSPLGPLGTRWGDLQVEAAAKLSELLLADWPNLKIHHIAVQDQNRIDAGHRTGLELVTRAGTKFVWGSPIGEEVGDERAAAVKLQRLKQLAGEANGLDGAPAESRDLRR